MFWPIIAVMLPPLYKAQIYGLGKTNCAQVKISVEFHEMAVRETKESITDEESSSSFKREANRVQEEKSITSFFGELANYAYTKVSERENAKKRTYKNLNVKDITFENNQLQLRKQVTTLMTVNGRTAKVIQKLHVATVSANKTKNITQLRKMAEREIVRLHGNRDGQIMFNSYFDQICRKGKFRNDLYFNSSLQFY